jgi:hypothetical protein
VKVGSEAACAEGIVEAMLCVCMAMRLLVLQAEEKRQR